MYSELNAVWSRFEELPYECEHPELPVNQSGVKVLVAGLAKTGTRTMSRSLFQIGLDHSYHSEEFNIHVWANLADNFWLRQNGGHWGQLPKPGYLHNINTEDVEVLNGTSPQELAAAISRCKVDAIAFDGLERLFWPIYHVSPDAKIILLNWRKFAEWQKSFHTFLPLLLMEVFFMQLLGTSQGVLPWGGLIQWLDPLLGRRIETLLRTGGPPICQVFPFWTAVFHGTVNFRRFVTRWFSGLPYTPETEEEYDAWYAEIKAIVPSERLFEWDMKKHTFEDLCRFVGIADCPRQGLMPRANNCFIFQRDNPQTAVCWISMLLILHWLNVKIFRLVWSVPARWLRAGPKVKGQ